MAGREHWIFWQRHTKKRPKSQRFLDGQKKAFFFLLCVFGIFVDWFLRVCVGVIVLWLQYFTFAAFVCSWFVSHCLDVPKQNRILLEGLSKWLGPKHLEKIRSPVTISGKNVRQDWLDDYQIVSSSSKSLFDGKLFEQWKKHRDCWGYYLDHTTSGYVGIISSTIFRIPIKQPVSSKLGCYAPKLLTTGLHTALPLASWLTDRLHGLLQC